MDAFREEKLKEMQENINSINRNININSIENRQIKLKPSTVRTNNMWLRSVWEHREEIDPELNPDKWFNNSVWLDKKDERIDKFWRGDSPMRKKNRTAESYWLRQKIF